MTTVSILFPSSEKAEVRRPQDEALFEDLALGRILTELTKGREGYGIEEVFAAPLSDRRDILYRQAVFRDLEDPRCLGAVAAFTERMRVVHEYLAQVERLPYARQKERFFLDAAHHYCRAVLELSDGLLALRPGSLALSAFTEELLRYVRGEAFQRLLAETDRLEEALGELAYVVHIHQNRVEVRRPSGEEDLSRKVHALFAKFRQGEVRDWRVRFPETPYMSHVEAEILDRVARLYPDLFRELAQFRIRHEHFLDPLVTRFEQEVQFYLAYLERTEPLRRAGLPLCYPEVVEEADGCYAEAMYDLALALKLVPEGVSVVPNDFALAPGERILVVTGPNQSGKTTFARAFGQIHYLARLGVPVPARAARLLLCDRVWTHFEREERPEDQVGKLKEELIRIRAVLDEATARSVVVLNESFASTTLDDARLLGRAVLERLLTRGALAVYVTFVEELSTVSDAVVSMAGEVHPEDPTRRTYRVVRRPADVKAYAFALAERWGLTGEQLGRELGRRFGR